jgi:PIN domain nuclease of toxin-antitoxin system
VKLLLDSHAVLWFLQGSPRLSSAAREAIESPDNVRLFSVAGAWEIAVKVSTGKLALVAPFEEIIPGDLRANEIELLPIEPEHVAAVIDLPFLHRDPFDRLMVAQAMVEDAVFVTADASLEAYGVPTLW